MSSILTVMVIFIIYPTAIYGFQPMAKVMIPRTSCKPTLRIDVNVISTISHAKFTTSSLNMYNLPPSGGGGKGPKNEFEAILPTITTGILVALFFASPLGGIFFAVFNSIFVLALLTPFVLFGGFQLWKTLYTIEDNCPSCGAIPVRVLKNGEPSVCLNCGAFSRANEKGDGIELCNNPNDMMGGGQTLFDQLFGPGMGGDMGGNGMSDFTNVGPGVEVSSTTKTNDDPVKKAKKQGTIIDVDVERD